MSDQRISNPQSHNVKGKVVEEFKRFVVIFLYLWLVFGLLSIHKSLVLSQEHLDYAETHALRSSTHLSSPRSCFWVKIFILAGGSRTDR